MLLEEYRVWVLLRLDFTGCSPILSSCFDHEYQFIRQSTGSWTSDPVVGWFSDFVAKNTPVLPLSAWLGANLLKKSDNLPSWKGLGFSGNQGVPRGHRVCSRRGALGIFPSSGAPLHMPMSGIYQFWESVLYSQDAGSSAA